MYFQRAAIKTVAIIGVPHQIYLHYPLYALRGDGSAKRGVHRGKDPPKRKSAEGKAADGGVRDGCGGGCGTREARERPQTHCLEVQMIDTMLHV